MLDGEQLKIDFGKNQHHIVFMFSFVITHRLLR